MSYGLEASDFNGNKMAGAPDCFYSVGLRYRPAPVHYLSAELVAQGVGEYFADDANTIRVPAYTVLSATIGIEDFRLCGNGLTLNGFFSMNNFFDKRYAASAFINPDRGPDNDEPIFLEAGLPRNWTGSMSLRWNM